MCYYTLVTIHGRGEDEKKKKKREPKLICIISKFECEFARERVPRLKRVLGRLLFCLFLTKIFVHRAKRYERKIYFIHIHIIHSFRPFEASWRTDSIDSVKRQKKNEFKNDFCKFKNYDKKKKSLTKILKRKK